MSFLRKRLAVWLVVGTGLGLFSGVSITGAPRWETVYNENTWSFCGGDSCAHLYQMQIGNTGWRDQSAVVARFKPGTLSSDQIKVALRARAVSPRPFTVVEGPHADEIRFGPLPAGNWYRLSVTATYKANEQEPKASLLEIRPAQGAVRKGSPDVLRFARLVYAVLGLFL